MVVTIPDPDPIPPESQHIKSSHGSISHEEIQYALLKLGSDMGLDVWVASNDKGRSFGGNSFNSIPRIRMALPRQFDEATNATVERIDVLWLDKDAFVAAFEVEHTTAIYSGLLRMADLVSMQPNLNIPLFIVAPDERREKVREEVNRPTFERMRRPLREICRFIPYSILNRRVKQLGDVARHLKVSFLDEVAESCALPAEESEAAQETAVGH